ncbi:MAG: glycoside hydrolase [Ignavibacteriales bacterium]|nr:MAG: glycoside hydrolase [Ignavibacteriales bacterium]
MILRISLYLIYFLTLGISVYPQGSTIFKCRIPDNGDGTYKKPIIFADYSDPDAIRVGEDYYITSSSFNCVPGLPILHSKDLVNRKIVCHVLANLKPIDIYDKPMHGCGVWAPSIRYHNNEFYIYWGDPDFGIYMIKSKEILGPWSEPLLVKEVKGWIDCCPFWDDDGNVYLVHAYAGSRAGIKSILVVNRMNSEGTEIFDEGVMVFDGHNNHPTVEGPKLYKRNGYYYIFAPAGGVKQGWQLVLRSKNIYGPYEEKIVLAQGETNINGPHQGAWIETSFGESWFIHFQDRGAYGRVVHLQPVKWIDAWPVIGNDNDGDGTGEPVLSYQKPKTGKIYHITTPQTSDEFNSDQLGLQWQWHANPKPYWAFPTGQKGLLRLFAYPLPDSFKNFWDVSNLLLQKFPAEEFTVTTKLSFHPLADGEKTGLIIMGSDYSYLSVKQVDKKLNLSYTVCLNADKGNTEKETFLTKLESNNIYLRVDVKKNAECSFSYSIDGNTFISIDEKFTAKPGKWIGAKIGLLCTREGKTNDAGYADVDWFRVE